MSEATADHVPSVGLALQGGGSHGAFTWGVLDRFLEEVGQNRLRFAALSGASAGAINAALTACGLASGGPEAARQKLRAFWTSFSRAGTLLGNALFGYGEPGPRGLDIDWSPMAIALEALGLVVSPYTNPFYSDALAPLIEKALPPGDLARLNSKQAPPVFLSATNISTNQRTIFTQPNLTWDALRASACLPSDFRTVRIDGGLYWDGGYLGNPAVTPLVDISQDLLLVVLNPFRRDDMPPISARAILDRTNEITFNASLVLELNGISAVNRVLAGIPAQESRYKPVRFHMIRNDKFMATLGFVSKSSTSSVLIEKLFQEGHACADRWLADHQHRLGHHSSCDMHEELIKPMMRAP